MHVYVAENHSRSLAVRLSTGEVKAGQATRLSQSQPDNLTLTLQQEKHHREKKRQNFGNFVLAWIGERL